MRGSTSRVSGNTSIERRRAAAQRECDAWNAQHKPGLECVVQLDDGERIQTFTKSAAWEVGGRAVILVQSVTGAYLLTRVKPA